MSCVHKATSEKPLNKELRLAGLSFDALAAAVATSPSETVISLLATASGQRRITVDLFSELTSDTSAQAFAATLLSPVPKGSLPNAPRIILARDEAALATAIKARFPNLSTDIDAVMQRSLRSGSVPQR